MLFSVSNFPLMDSLQWAHKMISDSYFSDVAFFREYHHLYIYIFYFFKYTTTLTLLQQQAIYSNQSET